MKLALACLLVIAAVPAAAQEKMQPAKPDPMLTDTFASAMGSWKCTSTWKAPDGKEMKTSSNMQIKKELNGFMYSLSEKTKASKEMPAMETHMHWGMSPTEHKILEVGYDTMGNSWMATGDGWQGDTLKSEGSSNMMGKTVKSRTTVTRSNGGKTISIVTETDSGGGTWSEMGKEECKK